MSNSNFNIKKDENNKNNEDKGMNERKKRWKSKNKPAERKGNDKANACDL